VTRGCKVCRPEWARLSGPALYSADGPMAGFGPCACDALPPLPINVGPVAAADFGFRENGRLNLFMRRCDLPGQYPAGPRRSALLANRGGKFEGTSPTRWRQEWGRPEKFFFLVDGRRCGATVDGVGLGRNLLVGAEWGKKREVFTITIKVGDLQTGRRAARVFRKGGPQGWGWEVTRVRRTSPVTADPDYVARQCGALENAVSGGRPAHPALISPVFQGHDFIPANRRGAYLRGGPPSIPGRALRDLYWERWSVRSWKTYPQANGTILARQGHARGNIRGRNRLGAGANRFSGPRNPQRGIPQQAQMETYALRGPLPRKWPSIAPLQGGIVVPGIRFGVGTQGPTSMRSRIHITIASRRELRRRTQQGYLRRRRGRGIHGRCRRAEMGLIRAR